MLVEHLIHREGKQRGKAYLSCTQLKTSLFPFSMDLIRDQNFMWIFLVLNTISRYPIWALWDLSMNAWLKFPWRVWPSCDIKKDFNYSADLHRWDHCLIPRFKTQIFFFGVSLMWKGWSSYPIHRHYLDFKIEMT